MMAPKVHALDREISLIRTNSSTERNATTNSRRDFVRSKNVIKFTSPADRTMLRSRSIISHAYLFAFDLQKILPYGARGLLKYPQQVEQTDDNFGIVLIGFNFARVKDRSLNRGP